MLLDYAMLSKVGNREINEDFIGVKDVGRGIAFALADGLGGHGRGEDASKSVVEDSLSIYEKSDADAISTLHDMFFGSQQLLMQKQKEQNCPEEMKTTLTLLCIESDVAYYGHIGDSRIYQFFKGKVKGRTLDHSVPQALVLAGEIKETQIRHHEDRNRLLRVMGMEWNEPRFELCKEPQPIKNGMAYLMCTDGFWEYITEKEMEYCYKKSKTVHEWMNMMEQIILTNGANYNMDNYSAIAIWLAN